MGSYERLERRKLELEATARLSYEASQDVLRWLREKPEESSYVIHKSCVVGNKKIRIIKSVRTS